VSEEPEKDLQFIWHPFTHLKYAERPLNIISSAGAYYFDEDGNRYLDAIASWWVNLHGHSHPYIAGKVAEQLKLNAHSIFSGFTHPQAIHLAERLIKILPGEMGKIFFSDDGSTAVEVAVKMAIQYFHNKGEARTRLIALENSYHGDTFGGMSLAARNAFNNAFTELLFDVVHLPLPQKENRTNCLKILKDEITKGNVAGFIYEPLIQGAGGMQMYDAEVLNELLAECKAAGVICIADEVMTGFGRTGKMFASEYVQEKPDIICLSKGITGGVMPLGVTACADFIHEAYIVDDKMKTFFHGHSYTGNPLACSAANASLDLFEKESTLQKIRTISNAHIEFKNKVAAHKNLKEVRCLGTIIAFELKTGQESGYLHPAAEKISTFFIQQKIIIRPLGNIFYILPPYCISLEDLEYIYSKVEEFLNSEA
jgi:adenosylmethionine---8-amino-7-oxononanoate aminotransferase